MGLGLKTEMVFQVICDGPTLVEMNGHVTAANAASNSYSPYMHAKTPLFGYFGISAFAALDYQPTIYIPSPPQVS